MRCDDVQEALPFYAQAEVPPDEQQVITHHLAVCRVCRQELEAVRHADRAIYTYVASAPAGDAQSAHRARTRQGAPGSVRLALPRRAVATLIAVVLASSVIGIAAAVYSKVIVVEPRAVPLPGAEAFPAVVERAPFPIWVPEQATLTAVQEIKSGGHYGVHLQYTLANGQQILLMEEKIPHRDQWEGVRVLAQNLEVNGAAATLYQTRTDYPDGRSEWGQLALHWHTAGTDLSLWLPPGSGVTRDELLEIARSLRPLRP